MSDSIPMTLGFQSQLTDLIKSVDVSQRLETLAIMINFKNGLVCLYWWAGLPAVQAMDRLRLYRWIPEMSLRIS